MRERVIRIQFKTSTIMLLGFSPLLDVRVIKAKRRECCGKRRVDFVSCGLMLNHRWALIRWLVDSVDGRAGVILGDANVCKCVVRVELDRTAECRDRFRKRFRYELIAEV